MSASATQGGHNKAIVVFVETMPCSSPLVLVQNHPLKGKFSAFFYYSSTEDTN